MALSAGTRLGPYEIFAPIGAGGMGEVYRAKDTMLGREVAVPANIMVTRAGVVKVLDFGLATSVEEPSAAVIRGTAAYMSPEQARGATADKRADIWAFGVVLYEMLSGKRAFPGQSVTDILAGVLRADPD